MDNNIIIAVVTVLVLLPLIYSFLGVSISVASHFRMIRVLREIRMIKGPQAAVKRSRKKR